MTPELHQQRLEVFTLPEGDVTLTWHDGLSLQSARLLLDWNHIVMRKIMASAGMTLNIKDLGETTIP